MVDADQVALARIVAGRRCARKVVTATGELVNCGSRSFRTCPKCAKVYRRDWQVILADGVRESSPRRSTFVLLTLTAPSFGKVHRVPKPGGKRAWCACGQRHTEVDRVLRGVPVDASRYDYAGQVRFNRDAGMLWRYTQIYLRRVLPEGTQMAAVREWQARGVLHFHVLVRVPGPVTSREALTDLLESTCSSLVARNGLDGSQIRWGKQVDARILGIEPGQVRRTIGYLGKLLGYVAKDLGSEAVGNGSPEAAAHVNALHRAARNDMACGQGCRGVNCGHRRHRSLGAASHAVSRSKEWSQYRRQDFKAQRRAWARANACSDVAAPGVDAMTFDEAIAVHREAFLTGVYASGAVP